MELLLQVRKPTSLGRRVMSLKGHQQTSEVARWPCQLSTHERTSERRSRPTAGLSRPHYCIERLCCP